MHCQIELRHIVRMCGCVCVGVALGFKLNEMRVFYALPFYYTILPLLEDGGFQRT